MLLNVVNGIALVPFYFRFFDLETYGSWLACQNVVTWLSVLELGFNLVFTQRLVQERPSPERFAATAGTGLVVTLASAFAVALAGVCLAFAGDTWMPTLLGATASNVDALRLGLCLASIGAAMTMSQAGFTALASAWLDMDRIGAINVASLALGIAGCFVGLWADLGVASLGVAACVRGVAGVVGVAWHVGSAYGSRCSAPLRFSAAVARDLLRTIALPGLARVFSTVASNSEATVAAALIDPAAAAALGLSSRLYDVARLLLVPISYSVFAPFADVVLRDGVPRARALYRELSATTLGLTMLLLLPALAINASFVRVWLGAEVFVGERVSLALAAAAFFYTFTNLQSVLMTAMGLVRESAIISIVDTVLRVLLLMSLPYVVGVVGIPIAGVVAGSATFVFCSVRLARGLGSRVSDLMPISELLALAGGALVAATIAWWIGPVGSWPELVIAGTVCAVAALAYTVTISASTRGHAASAVRKLWR
ncbi:MAG: lipopolysaccharide biosynthesis protein [Myxococcota bacterium]|nr:hypothetical protein [Myxococcota bacterium]